MHITIKSLTKYATLEQWSSGAKPADGQTIEAGETVDYIAHVIGGMVKVRYKGQEVIIHPAATEQLG